MWENQSHVPVTTNQQYYFPSNVDLDFWDPAGPQTTDAWEVFAGLVRSGLGRGATSGPTPGSVDHLPSGYLAMGNPWKNGGFYGKIIYFYGPFFYHGYVSQNSRG